MHDMTGMASQRTSLLSVIDLPPEWHKLPEKVQRLMGRYLNRTPVRFGEQWVVDSLTPPFPSPAFDRFVDRLVRNDRQDLFSVSLAVTNDCCCHCERCYNAGRRRNDLPLAVLQRLAGQFQEFGAVLIALTGGEPLLRPDLELICSSFDKRCCVVVNATGFGLTLPRALALKEVGVFAVSIRLDSLDPATHDRLSGRPGAFEDAVEAIKVLHKAELYPYVMTMARPELVDPKQFFPFMEFAGAIGAMEVRFLDPIPVGGLSGKTDAVLSRDQLRRMLRNAREVNGRDDLPLFTTSACQGKALGCQAGLGHVYVDGSGELCPCNYIPCSFGNLGSPDTDALTDILDRMRQYFRKPRKKCAAAVLADYTPKDPVPTDPETSASLCRAHLPMEHAVPLLYELCEQRRGGLAESPAFHDADGTYVPERRLRAGKKRKKKGTVIHPTRRSGATRLPRRAQPGADAAGFENDPRVDD